MTQRFWHYGLWGVALAFWTSCAVASPCTPPQQVPTIHIEIRALDPTVDHSLMRDQLKRFDIATVSPYGTDRNVHVNGLMRGAIELETQSSIAWQRDNRGENNCFWFNHVALYLKLQPKIYIASEIPAHSCLYREVLRHEYKHYDVDYATARDYRAVFQRELESLVRDIGVIGPFTAQHGEQPKQMLTQRLQILINKINQRMSQDRVARQAKVDTLDEYNRVAASCPGEAYR